LLALLAISGGSERRILLASTLWPDTTEERALANLRSVYWRARRDLPSLVNGDATNMWLSSDIEVDYLSALVMPFSGTTLRDPKALLHDLLPDWQEEWLRLPRFLFRVIRLQLVEAVVSEQSALGNFEQATILLNDALRCEPLRESLHRLMADVLLADGRRNDAISLCTDFRSRLCSELGIEPSLTFREWEARMLQTLAQVASPA
jgi:DNA-binding SARP family transcriptional activator